MELTREVFFTRNASYSTPPRLINSEFLLYDADNIARFWFRIICASISEKSISTYPHSIALSVSARLLSHISKTYENPIFRLLDLAVSWNVSFIWQLKSTNNVAVLDSSLWIEFVAWRRPNQPQQVHIIRLFSDRMCQPLQELW